MENNFFVGVVRHQKRIFKAEYSQKLVLYKIDNRHYLDLVEDIIYSTSTIEKDYVEEETLIPTEITNYRVNYSYLLSKHNSIITSKKSIEKYINRPIIKGRQTKIRLLNKRTNLQKS